MKTQHTPGPWKVDEFGYINAGGKQIADVHVYDSKDCMDCGQCERHSVRNEPKLPYQANARLMAAAPEMLDLLSECLEQLEALHYLYEGEFSERIEAADKAAVKAWKLIAKLTAE